MHAPIVMYTRSTKSSSKKVKILTPRHQTTEAYRKLGLSLPPIPTSPRDHTAEKNGADLKEKNGTVASFIFGRNLSDYVRKPVYFCHPVIVPTRKLTRKTAILSSASPEDTQQISQLTSDELLAASSKAKLCEKCDDVNSCSDQHKTKENPSKFLAFCRRESYDIASDIFVKVSSSFRKHRKYSRISRPPSLWTLKEHNNHESPGGATLLTLRERLSRERSLNSTKQSIRDGARLSAVKGQFAATKAISFILTETKVKRRLSLPPLDRTSLTTFDSTWKPDTSVVGNSSF